MKREDVVIGMTEAALRAYRADTYRTDEAKMLSAVRAALEWLDDEADLSALKRYVEGEWSRQELSAMRYDLSLAD